MIMLRGEGKGYFFLLLLLLIFVYSVVHTSVYAASNLEDRNSNKNSPQQQMSRSEEMNKPEGLNGLKSNYTPSLNGPRSLLEGTPQIPYTGLVTRSMSPSLAERLGLDATTRGDVIVDIIPGSPAEGLGMRALNMSRSGSIEEIIASRGDIIFAVDDSTIFTINYRNIEQYVFENKRVGENITLSLLRDGQLKDIEMTIASMPRFLWYENRNEGIKIEYPFDWTIDEGRSIDEEVVNFYSPEASPGSIPVANISLTKYLSVSSNDASKTSGPSIRTDIEIFRILDINTTTLGKLSGYSTIFYDYSQKNNTQKVLTVFVERDSQLYSVNFSADPTRFDDYLSLAREMIKSFQFIDDTWAAQE